MLQIVYTQTVVDRTGVDAANREDAPTLADLADEAEDAQIRAAFIKAIGYDQRGRYHGPGGIQRASVAAETVPLRVRMVNAAWLALVTLAVAGAWAGLIWAAVKAWRAL